MGIPRKLMHAGGLVMVLLSWQLGNLNVSLVLFLISIIMIACSRGTPAHR